MFWPSSSTYTGYGKGQYSHALPAGVAFIGLLFLAVGVIIAIRFPGIITDWTKVDVCIVKETHKRYQDWITDADRDVTVRVYLRDTTNSDSVKRFGAEPQHEWIGPFNYTEQNRKKAVQFLPQHRLTFRKDLLYYPSDESPSAHATVSLPNLWLLRQYATLGDPASWFYQTLPQLLAETASSHFSSDRSADWSTATFWTNISTSDCGRRAVDVSYDLCSRYSFYKWAERKNYAVNMADLEERQQPWKRLLLTVLTESFNQTGEVQQHEACLRDIAEQEAQQKDGAEIEFWCPACFLEQNPSTLLLLNYLLLERYSYKHVMWSRLRPCYSKYGLANASVAERQFYAVMVAVNEYFSGHLRKELLLDRAARLGVFESADVTTASVVKPLYTESNGWRLGVLPAVFGSDGDHLYEWNTCDVRWDINADINFQWRSLDSRQVEWTPQSEYFIPPASNSEPCLRPSAPRRLVLMLEGLWHPAIFLFDRSDTLYEQMVYNYQLTAGSLPYEDDLSDHDLKINLAQVLGFPSFLTPFPYPGHNGIVGTDDIVAKIQVEPITGVIWHVHLRFELSVVIPEEIAKAANLTTLAGQRVAIARIIRNTTVHAQAAEFLSAQLKPMLAIICGGVVVSTLCAIAFVGLALALVLKLHWKPFRERQVQPEPQDLRLLNTIKLRKLLGN